MADVSSAHLDEYFLLLKNLEQNQKLKIIARLTDSMIKESSESEAIFYSLFGSLKTDDTAEELIDNIYSSRHFSRDDISL